MKKITTILALLLFYQMLHAQEDSLLYYYRQKALEYQQRIKMAERQLSSAESKVETSKSNRLPRLDFNSDYTYYGVPLKLAPPAGSTEPGAELNNFYSLNLDLYQPILTGGYLKNTQMAAESEVSMMQNLLNMNKQQIMLTSDIAYWNAVSKKEIYHLYTAYKGIISEFLKVIKDRVDEEVVGKNELYQTQVRYNDAEYQAIRSRKDFIVSLMDLNRLIGVPVSEESRVSDSISVVNWQKFNENITETALNQRPEIGYYKSQILKNEYNEKIVASKYNPELGVRFRGKWGSPSPGLQIDPAFNYNFKAQLSIPIFYWGMKKEEVMSIRQMTEVTRLQMEETKDKVKMEVESAYYQLEKTQEQLDFARSSLNNAAMNVSVFLDRYNEGLSSVLEVLDAQMGWQKTYMNFIIAKYELNVAYAQFLYAIGQFSQLSQN